MRAMVFMLLLALLGACATSGMSDSERAAQVDELMADYSGPGRPGAAVTVIENGRAILSRAYGLAEVATNKPVTATTNFRLASITKQFTATAVLMQVEQGKLELDDPIRKHFPEFGAYAADITVRHLLQHTSGIEDYEPLYGDRFPNRSKTRVSLH